VVATFFFQIITIKVESGTFHILTESHEKMASILFYGIQSMKMEIRKKWILLKNEKRQFLASISKNDLYHAHGSGPRSFDSN